MRLYETHLANGRYAAADTSERIEVVQNRIVFFPSVLMHEVMKVQCPSAQFVDSRFAVNGWVHW